MDDLETQLNIWKSAEQEVSELRDHKWKTDNWPIVVNLITAGRTARGHIITELNLRKAKTKDLEEELELYKEKLRVSQDKLVTVQSDLISRFKETAQNLERTVEKQCNLTESLQNNVNDFVPKIQHFADSVSKKDKDAPSEQPTKDQIRYKLMVEEQSGEKITDQLWTTVVKSNVRRKLQNLPVSNSYMTQNGVPTMTFPSAQTRDEAAKVLMEDFTVTSLSEPLKTLSPKLKILDVAQELIQESDEHIIEELRLKNSCIDKLMSAGDELKIIYKKKEDNIVVIRTTRKIKEAIKAMNNRIYLGLQLLNVRDHIHLIQCYHCQEFGHYAGSIYCKSKEGNSTCFYCASTEHKSANCKDKKNAAKHRCINCTREGRQQTHHKATDQLCPAVTKETLRTYSRTDGMDTESKNSYLKMIEKLRQKRTLS